MIRDLPVKLTDEELRAKASQLAHQIQELSDTEEEKKETAANYATDIKSYRSKMNLLSREIVNKAEYREVECEEDFDYETVTVLVIRQDTREVVSTRTMTPDERKQGQLKMFPAKVGSVDLTGSDR